MTLLMAVEGAEELKQGIWRLSLPPHQALMFGDCRNHQGKGNHLLFPASDRVLRCRTLHRRDRLGGLLKFYFRAA